MPGLDGFALCYKIRNELNLIPLYVILLTGRGGRANTSKGFEPPLNGPLCPDCAAE